MYSPEIAFRLLWSSSVLWSLTLRIFEVGRGWIVSGNSAGPSNSCIVLNLQRKAFQLWRWRHSTVQFSMWKYWGSWETCDRRPFFWNLIIVVFLEITQRWQCPLEPICLRHMPPSAISLFLHDWVAPVGKNQSLGLMRVFIHGRVTTFRH